MRWLPVVTWLACSDPPDSRPPPEAPACGNAVVEGDEACDDGNARNDDACLSTCVEASCGDGFVHRGIEACDDGDDDDSDECRSSCELARCGDGVLWSGVEACDEGEDNGAAGARCHEDCRRVAWDLDTSEVPLDPSADHWREPVRLYAVELDGRLGTDVLVAVDVLEPSAGSGAVHLLGDGTGALRGPILGEEGRTAAADLELADVDSDGILDVVGYGSPQDVIAVQVGADDALGPIATWPTASDERGLSPLDVEVFDQTGDGVLDVVVNTRESLDLTVLAGDGAGGFLAPSHLPLPELPQSYRADEMVQADVDGDGNADIVLGEAFSAELLVFRSAPGPFDPPVVGDTDAAVRLFAGFDHDHDGDDEIVGFSASTGDLVVQDLDGDTLVVLATIPAPVGADACEPAFVPPARGDADGDGRDDVLFACEDGRALLLSHGPAPSEPELRALQCGDCGTRVANDAQMSSVRLADADDDGAVDALAVFAGGEIAIWWSDGTGPQEPAASLVAHALVWGFARDVGAARVGDVTGDGRSDIVVATEGRYPAVLRGIGNRTFLAPGAVTNGFVSDVVAADLDGDGVAAPSFVRSAADGGPVEPGDVTIDVGRWVAGLTRIVPNLDGTATAGALVGRDPVDPLAARIDGDALDDLVYLSTFDAHAVVHFGADGVLGASVAVPLSATDPTGLTAGDVDGDGRTDLAIVDAGRVELRLGDGAGGFSGPRFVPVSADRVALVDLDADGADDLIAFDDVGARIFPSAGDGGVGDVARTVDAATAVARGDVDGDGLLDTVWGTSEAEIRVEAGFASGAASAPTSIAVHGPVIDVVASDLDADGRDEIIVADRADGVTVVR